MHKPAALVVNDGHAPIPQFVSACSWKREESQGTSNYSRVSRLLADDHAKWGQRRGLS